MPDPSPTRFAPGDHLPLPDHPLLAAWARALDVAGYWADVCDTAFRVVYVTHELRRSTSGLQGLATVPIGQHYFGPEAAAVRANWMDPQQLREVFTSFFSEMLAATPGGRPELRTLVDSRFLDLVDELPDVEPQAAFSYQYAFNRSWGINLGTWRTFLQIKDASGAVAGYVRMLKPAAGMSILGTVASGSDVRHLERMQQVVTAERRPAAILFADIEASSPLARRLPTADYFALARRLVRAADECVVEAGGLVGRHLGDGITAFFLAEMLGIEACATGGRVLASKALIERLHSSDAKALGLDRVTYTPLGELTTATEKARRDAPAIAVCDV